ncbi:MAG: hypothetical protein EHM61_21795 [Acidobacteria bacterium]|nr:MAG: hypothetical protein EHM61_21795 [Acidobacteriota bacterium]
MSQSRTSRRVVLKSAVGLAGGLAIEQGLPAQTAASAKQTLPTVQLGSHRITRLVIGSNPFNGFCYALPSLSAHMKEWCTPERIAQLIRHCQQNGINTWQFSYYESSLAALKLLQGQGGEPVQWILLTGGAIRNDPSKLAAVAKLKPLAIVHHGGVTDEHFHAGTMEKVRDYLKAIRDTGVMVGLSTHLPAVVEFVEERNWDLDFYMTCFYQFSRTTEEVRKMVGEMPLGYVFLEGDPARMCRVIRQTRKTCLAFKILAAGRLADPADNREKAFRFAFDNIKPQDAVIVGMYPRFKDEISENAQTVRRILSS